MPTFQLRPANYGKRALAYIIDVLFILVPPVVGVILALVLLFSSKTRGVGFLLVVVSGGWFLLAGLWNDVVRQGTTGSTWGKNRQSLALVNASTGKTVGIGLALVRILAFWLFNTLTGGIFLIVDLLAPAFTKRNQRLVDMLLSTLVVDTGPVSESPNPLHLGQVADPGPVDILGGDPLA
ncbi:MAG: hypothetical protein CMM60_11565 [Rhodospirillaceae bacterium]|jgi:uncharacterized RDD family membrane protein YckC|nr:hypothetical protein [Rhodospirillaceae bacterium]|tara:strand:+ start:749 stop:1288 length:540 start_codon:yes stop_codon:yes gene_type:complete